MLEAQAAFFRARRAGLPATAELEESKRLEREVRKTLDALDAHDAEAADAAQGKLLF